MFNMLLWKSREIAPERMKWQGQSTNNAQLWMHMVVKINPDDIKTNTA